MNTSATAARVVALTLTAALMTALPKPANGAEFLGLGDLPGGDFSSVASDVSADGSVVVGLSVVAISPSGFGGFESFRWENNTMVGLGYLPGGGDNSSAVGVSADGSVVVGASDSASGGQAFRWENNTMVGLGDLPGGDFISFASDVSADGSVVVGTGRSATGDEAFRWENGTMAGLGDLPGGGSYSQAFGVSADGSVVVGASSSTATGSGTFEAFRWENDTMVALGDLPGGDLSSQANAVSADGSVVVGWGSSASSGFRSEAFRWENGTMVGLGDLPGGFFSSEANDVSADGTVVVGRGSSPHPSIPSAGTAEAFIWDQTHGMRSLQDVLTDDFGLDLTGWRLISANAITPDGMTIVGQGVNPSGDTEAWIAVLAPHGNGLPGDYNVDGEVNAADYVVWRKNLGTDFDLPNRDPILSGDIGQADYDHWIANFGRTAGNVSSQLPSITVPEPASVLLLIIAAAVRTAAARRIALRVPSTRWCVGRRNPPFRCHSMEELETHPLCRHDVAIFQYTLPLVETAMA